MEKVPLELPEPGLVERALFVDGRAHAPRDVPAVPGGVEDGDGLAVAPCGLGVVLGRVLVDGLRHEADGRVQAH